MAGELLTADYQVELGGSLYGFGTDYHIAQPGITGLGVPQPRVSDVELDHGDGVWLGRDYQGVRVITIPFVVVGTPAVAAGLYMDLVVDWQPTTENTELHMQLPGFGHLSVTGRPRGLTDDLTELRAGVVRAIASFWCGDPTISYYA